MMSSLILPFLCLQSIFLLAAFLSTAVSFSVDLCRFPGIWKMKCKSDREFPSNLKELFRNEREDEILLQLNADNTFKQCNEGERSWITGCWEISYDKKLVLAISRRNHRQDIVLEGGMQEDECLQVSGSVLQGKFMYPESHPSFFEQPLANQEILGSFTLEQYLATNALIQTVEESPVVENKFKTSDFYGLGFIMTVEAVELREENESEPLNLPVDIRAMPIQFFKNNTFAAKAVNKILRGRFDITKDDKLEFGVSLFGSGRSISGSVFSEGAGLTHEDERNYLGSIDKSNGQLFVEGTVTFGADLGSDARPEPVGTFLLTETNSASVNVDEDWQDDVQFDSVFE